MNDFLMRTHLVLGDEGINILQNATVAVIGVGGVGSFSAEALARSGVGNIVLVDKDVIDVTNVNRQIHALHSTVGMLKVEVMKERLLDINPNIKVITYKEMVNADNFEFIFENDIDFLIDAIDTISSKALLIEECINRKIKYISAMGAANKMDPTKFTIENLWKTSYDPVAKVLRNILRKKRLKDVKIPVVYSTEKPAKINYEDRGFKGDTRKQQLPPASISFVPSVSGLIAASYCVNTLCKDINIEKNGEK